MLNLSTIAAVLLRILRTVGLFSRLGSLARGQLRGVCCRMTLRWRGQLTSTRPPDGFI